ncbi:hypothetical protein PGR6_23470 [Pseudomonas sp. GR 6-02]|nr:hypothetical protein PGR6_23470 [Pseudomonas sp. GR 6-02]
MYQVLTQLIDRSEITFNRFIVKAKRFAVPREIQNIQLHCCGA